MRLVLEALVEEGKITLSKRGKYSKGKPRVLTGTFQANARGFGFVLPDAEGEEDLFIPEECKNGAFQGDQVEVLVTGYKEGGLQRRKDSADFISWDRACGRPVSEKQGLWALCYRMMRMWNRIFLWQKLIQKAQMTAIKSW